MIDQAHLLPPLPAGTVPADISAFLPPAEALAEAWAGLPPAPGLAAPLASLGAPAADLLATPASARAGVLGLGIGRGFHHHELRVRLPMPPGLEPELPVWAAGLLPAWQDGVLAEPKYFSFFQDEPHSAFNPNHRGKWRSHELLHGVVGFLWHPGLTRFEAYLGGRLGEILPVVHWYGLDEMFRARCPAHQGQAPERDTCPVCEAAGQAPYWALDRQAELGRATAWAQTARRHLAAEWAAVIAELETGRRVRSPSPTPFAPLVDGSSDAEGYLLGHWNRLTAWSMGAWVERFLVAGVDHEARADALAARLARTCHALTSGPLAVDLARSRARAERRVLQDLGYRILLCLEEDEALEEELMPAVDGLARAAGTLLAGGAVGLNAAVEEALGRVDAVAHRLPGERAAAIGALGYRWCRREAHIEAGLDQLMDGLRDALPDAFGTLADQEEAAFRFADSEAFDLPGPLCRRFAAWWTEQGGPDADGVRLEAMIRDLPRKDEEAELFGVLPEQEGPLAPERLRANLSLRRAWVDPEVLDGEEGAELDRIDEDGRVEVAVAWLQGEPTVVILDEALAKALDAVQAGLPAPRAAVDRLLEGGLLVWWDLPDSRRG